MYTGRQTNKNSSYRFLRKKLHLVVITNTTIVFSVKSHKMNKTIILPPNYEKY